MSRKATLIRWVVCWVGMIFAPWLCAIGIVALLHAIDDPLKLALTLCVSVLCGVPFLFRLPPLKTWRRGELYTLAVAYFMLASLGMIAGYALLFAYAVAKSCANGHGCL